MRPRLMSWTERFAAAAAATATFPRLQTLAEGLNDRFRAQWPAAVIPAYPALADPRSTLARLPGWWEPGGRLQRHQPVQGEDGLAGGHDRLVGRVVWVMA